MAFHVVVFAYKPQPLSNGGPGNPLTIGLVGLAIIVVGIAIGIYRSKRRGK